MRNTTESFRLGIFIMMKYPEVGNVKARLAQDIGAKSATSLYRAFILDTLETVKSLSIPFHIAFYPPESLEVFQKWLGQSYQFFHQNGMNLGKRLQNGFKTMFKKEYQQVIALASDSPDLPLEILKTAISSLKTHKVVIGPASDGGYYLIGFSKDLFIPDAFEDISWSTETVFSETLTHIESVTQEIHILPEWADIDTKSDLKEFYEKHRFKTSKNLHTMNYLLSHPELVQDD